MKVLGVSISVEDDKTHSVWTEWGSIKGLDAETAVAAKTILEKAIYYSCNEGIAAARNAANDLLNGRV